MIGVRSLGIWKAAPVVQVNNFDAIMRPDYERLFFAAFTSLVCLICRFRILHHVLKMYLHGCKMDQAFFP